MLVNQPTLFSSQNTAPATVPLKSNYNITLEPAQPTQSLNHPPHSSFSVPPMQPNYMSSPLSLPASKNLTSPTMSMALLVPTPLLFMAHFLFPTLLLALPVKYYIVFLCQTVLIQESSYNPIFISDSSKVL